MKVNKLKDCCKL